jgi:hypothetical protein
MEKDVRLLPDGPIGNEIIGLAVEIGCIERIGLDEAIDLNGLVAFGAQLVQLIRIDDSG